MQERNPGIIRRIFTSDITLKTIEALRSAGVSLILEKKQPTMDKNQTQAPKPTETTS